MYSTKARTMTKTMKRALLDGSTPPKEMGLTPDMIHVDCVKGQPRPWYDKVKPVQCMAVKSKTARTNAKLGYEGTTTRYKRGFSGGVGKA